MGQNLPKYMNVSVDGYTDDNSTAIQARREIEAGYIAAINKPRNEAQKEKEIKTICAKASFAEDALYSYPRGEEDIVGISVKAAREFARLWGNIRYGGRIIDMTDDEVTVEGFAIDLENNVPVQMPARFPKRIWRKKIGYIEPNDRDLRELINKHIAICIRNAILSLLPYWLTAEAKDLIINTNSTAVSADIKKTSKEDVLVKLQETFQNLNITKDAIEDYVGKSFYQFSRSDIVELRQLYKAIKDGQVSKQEIFAYESSDEEIETDMETAKQAIDKIYDQERWDVSEEKSETLKNENKAKEEEEENAGDENGVTELFDNKPML